MPFRTIVKNPRWSPWDYAVDPKKGRFSYREKESGLEAPSTQGDIDAEDRFNQQLVDRYGRFDISRKNPTPDLGRMGQRMMNDLGMKKYDVVLDINKHNPNQGQWFGEDNIDEYDKRAYKIELGGEAVDLAPAHAPSTMLHELGHMAVNIGNAGMNPWGMEDRGDEGSRATGDVWNPGEGFLLDPRQGHLGDLRSDLDLRRVVDEQTRIERGERPDPNHLAEYPDLKKVAPYSSNRLAVPWTKYVEGPTAVPPGLWNRKVWEHNPEALPKDRIYGPPVPKKAAKNPWRMP